MSGIVIRPEQMLVFDTNTLNGYVDRMVAMVASHRPDLAEQLIREKVLHTIEVCKKHEMTTEGPVATVIEVMAAFGWDFERSPHGAWARTTLADAKLPGRVRAMMIRDRLTAGVGGRKIVTIPGESEGS